MRGGIKSVEAVKRLASMYDDSESWGLFDFHRAKEADASDVALALKRHGLGFSRKLLVVSGLRTLGAWLSAGMAIRGRFLLA